MTSATAAPASRYRSRQELADLVSASFETAIRVLARWERAGVVSTDAEGFTLKNLAALRGASGLIRVERARSAGAGGSLFER